MKNWIVLKFGGTSVAAPSSWQTIAEMTANYRQQGLRPLVVCSALSGVSNLLQSLVTEHALAGEQAATIAMVKEKHAEFANALDLDLGLLDEDFAELERIALGISLTQEVSPVLHAKVMAFGELMLTKLGAAYLLNIGVKVSWQDARQLLVSEHDAALSETQNVLAAHCAMEADPTLRAHCDAIEAEVILTQGFIVADTTGRTVLLGRGGSDTSAAYFAAKLQAQRCEIWTDVPGIYTTNPHLVPAAKLLKHLSFDEAKEIAATGAKVLHPNAIDPCRMHNIPLSVHCTPHPEWDGTTIDNQVPLEDAQVKALSLQTGVTVISMEGSVMWHQAGFLSNVFACFKRHSVSVNLVATSENNVTVTLDTQIDYGLDILQPLLDDLQHFCAATVIKPCAAISLVGRNIRAILYQLAPVFEVFKAQKMYLLSQATNDLNLTVVVDETNADKLIHKIHALLFEEPNDPAVFGKSWQNAFPATIRNDYWWYQKRAELLALATKQTPMYVYSRDVIVQRATEVQALSQIDRQFYAIKANCNADVLQVLEQAGFGFECVSQGELEFIFKLFPAINPERVLFTPNFAERHEYEFAFSKNVFVNLDNVHPLDHWPDIFAGKSVLLRIDPGLGRGHHKYVQTGGSHSKFGISVSQLSALHEALQANKTTVIGLHVHFGSGVMAANSWSETAIFLAKLSQEFPDVKYLDLGGGLGVPEKFGQPRLHMAALDEALAPIKQAYAHCEFWLEPGRYLVAEAGVLLARVTQMKDKGDVNYIGVNAGMNSLIRPSLYSAYHEIVNLTRLDEPRTQVAHIVGPICETGDTLGYSRVMAPTAEGDIVLIANAGAYGAVMSSRYNLREPAVEVVI